MRHASVDLGSACKWPSYSAPWVALDTMQFYIIQTGLLLESIRIFGIKWIHWTISHTWVIVLVCKVSLISPLPVPSCVWGEGGIVIPWSYFYFKFHKYSWICKWDNFIYDYWMNGLVKVYHWWYKSMQQGQIGVEFSSYLLFIIFTYFLKFSSVLMNMQFR